MSYKIKSPLMVSEGGTQVTSFTTAYAPVCAGTTAAGALQVASTGLSTSGFILTSTGASSLPSFQAPAPSSISITGNTGGALTGNSFTFTGGTTGLSFGGSGTTETLTFAGITANGGTVSLATDATTSTINVGTGAGVKTSSFGSTNTTSTTTVQSGSGALNITSTNGALTANSGTGAMGISTDASATTVSIGTGAAVKTVTVGSTNTTSTTTVQSGSGALNITSTNGVLTVNSGTGNLRISNDSSATTLSIGTGAAAKTVTVGSINTTSATTVQSGSGNLNLSSVGGNIIANCGTGSVSISTDGFATTLSVGTGAAAKTVTVGSTNSTSTTTIQSGSGGTNLPGFVTLDATTSSTAGVVYAGANRYIHSYSSVTNTFLGTIAGNFSLTGNNLTGVGRRALTGITSGVANTALGYNTMDTLTTGSYNTAIGENAGGNYTGAESHNININTGGTVGESNVLSIGNGTGTGTKQLNKAIICGISGITVTGAAVLVSTANQLGVAASSRRFKDNIEDMGDISSDLMKLRAVKFNYNVGDDRSRQTGLIAEEVHEIMPALVVYDKEGLPQTVKYHDLPALLLNELQKTVRKLEDATNRISALEAIISAK